jgi:hypothetical protein
MDKQVKKRCYIYTVEYYSVIKKNKILSFGAAWIELEDIMLKEIDTERKTLHVLMEVETEGDC